jgi:hypothetical protein
VSSRAAVSCALASVIASLPAGRVSAAVVLLAHGLAEGLAACRFGLRVVVAVLIAGVPLALPAAELTAFCGWLVLSVAGAPSPPAPVAAVVSDASGVEVLSDGDGDGEPVLGGGVGDGDPEDDVLGELLVELDGLVKRAFGLGVFLHPGVAELYGWLDEGTADPEPSGFGCPAVPPGLVGLVP